MQIFHIRSKVQNVLGLDHSETLSILLILQNIVKGGMGVAN